MTAVATICVSCGTITSTPKRGRCSECWQQWSRDDGQRRQAHPRAAVYANPRWKTAARACLARDHWRCVHCGRHKTDLQPNERLGADHITGVMLQDPFDLTGLQTLCSRCSGAKDGKRAHHD